MDLGITLCPSGLGRNSGLCNWSQKHILRNYPFAFIIIFKKPHLRYQGLLFCAFHSLKYYQLIGTFGLFNLYQCLCTKAVSKCLSLSFFFCKFPFTQKHTSILLTLFCSSEAMTWNALLLVVSFNFIIFGPSSAQDILDGPLALNADISSNTETLTDWVDIYANMLWYGWPAPDYLVDYVLRKS